MNAQPAQIGPPPGIRYRVRGFRRKGNDKMSTNGSGRREITRLIPRHHRICDLALIGTSVKDIADIMGLSRSHVNMVCNSPIFQKELSRREINMEKSHDEAGEMVMQEVRTHLEGHALSAVRVQAELLESEDDRTKQTAVDRILDRTWGPVDKGRGAKDGSGVGVQQPVVVLQGAAVENLTVAITEARDDCLPGELSPLD